MALVCHEKKYIYLKPFKTAGTTVEIFFEPDCLPPELREVAMTRDETISEYGIVGYRGPRPNPLRRIWEHVTARQLRNYIGGDVWDDYFKFCTIRNPYDKIVSYFWDITPPDQRAAFSELAFEDLRKAFNVWLKAENPILYDGDRYRVDGNLCVDYFIRYESLIDGIKEVCDKVGTTFDIANLGHYKSAERGKKAHYSEYYDEESRALVEEAYAWEFEHFDYGFEESGSGELKALVIEQGRGSAMFHGSWYRGKHTNFIPSKESLKEPGCLEDYVFLGWLPGSPVIDRSSRITAFGSCFAANISNYLHERGYKLLCKSLDLDAHIIRFGEGIVNSFTILQQLEWALEGRAMPENIWFGPKKEIAPVDPNIQRNTLEIIKSTDVFIFTLGLSEIWYDKKSGEAFWRAIPEDFFDEDVHGFRITTVEENAANLQKIRSLIRKHLGDKKIIFTLSPIPLMATFRPVSCVTANTVSKATLRVAIDQVMRDNEDDDNLFYFPSYELVKEIFVDPFLEDNRHIKPEYIEVIMQSFERNFCE
ncbi:MAG: GSCFA domain-containing protein [Rhodospirillales bacterium]|nr:GSCFA domain-containing protein [Rhodospirillales bacterium]